MNAYTPRRCGKRWLDADCPREVLAIMDYGAGTGPERYDVFYTDVHEASYGIHPEHWLDYFCLGESGHGYHGEIKAHELAAHRYRCKHRYIKWSTLPDAVKNAVRQDIEDAKDYAKSEDAKK